MVAEPDRLGIKIREVAADGGFKPGPTDTALAYLHSETVCIAGRQEAAPKRTTRRLRRYRRGEEGRISHLKRCRGLGRSRLKGDQSRRIWNEVGDPRLQHRHARRPGAMNTTARSLDKSNPITLPWNGRAPTGAAVLGFSRSVTFSVASKLEGHGLERPLDRSQELSGLGPIERTVIPAQAEDRDRPDRNRVVALCVGDHHGSFHGRLEVEDPHLGLVDDRRGHDGAVLAG